MVQLSDLLSSSSKQHLLSEVGRGDIIKLELTPAEGVKPKHMGETSRNKYFVILGKTADGKLLGFVLINSNVNTNININLQKAHYPISAKRYTFLQHDSYVFCGQIKEISMENFAERYKCQSFGKLEQDDLENIMHEVRNSDNIPPKVPRSLD